jgi:hypothetical protein
MSLGGDDTAKGNTILSKIMMIGDDSLCEWIIAPVAFAFEWIKKENTSSGAGKQFVLGSGCLVGITKAAKHTENT